MKKRGEIEGLIRRLRQTLFISGFLNIVLLTLIFYHWASPVSFEMPKSRPDVPALSKHTSSGQLMISSYQMPFHQLVNRLEEQGPVECGYSVRDFALACLVAKFHFDLPRALDGIEPPERLVTFHGQEHLGPFPLYPGLSDHHYQRIVIFAKTEKWPFTAEGLFIRMQQHQEKIPKSLAHAFMMTREFITMSQRFPDRNPLEVARMMLDVDWTTCISALKDSLPEQILIDYLQAGSPTAARMLLESDFHYAVRQLDDSSTLRIFELLGETHPLSERYAEQLLQTPRGDDVWNLARAQAAVHEKEPEELLYMVQEGDSLWKISRHYHVELDDLKRLNHLDSDNIRPGKILKIP